METLPTELKTHIFANLSFQNVIDLLFVTKEFKKIVVSFFLMSQKRIPKYIISYYDDYLILIKFKPRVKTLMIQSQIINTNRFNLTDIDYERLFLKVVILSINDVVMLDANISQKCKKITLYGLILTENFMLSLACLDVCETFRFYRPAYYNPDRECKEYDNYFKSISWAPKIRKIVLSYWVLCDQQIKLLSGTNIIKIKKSHIYGNLSKLSDVSQFYAIECRSWLPKVGCYSFPRSFEMKNIKLSSS